MVQPDPIVCLDALTDTTYSPGEEWTQTRIFQKGPTAGMEGQFRLAFRNCLVFELDLMGFLCGICISARCYLILGVNAKKMVQFLVAHW